MKLPRLFLGLLAIASLQSFAPVHAQVSGGPPSAPTLASALAAGKEFYEKRQYAEAEAAFTRAVAADPNSAEAFAGRALARRGLNDDAGASADIERALSLDPRSADAYRARSMVRRARGDAEGALADANRAVELAPSNPRAYLTRGLAKQALKDAAGAVRDFDRAIEMTPSFAMSWAYRAQARLDALDYPGAAADYDRFIALDSTQSFAFVNRGLVREKLGDVRGAAADYAHAITLDPANETAQRNYASLAQEEGKTGAKAPAPDVEIFNSSNAYAVSSQPTAAATFSLARPHVITSIWTYHWNRGRGASIGTIALRDDKGVTWGPFPATGTPGQGGVPNANWTCTPNVRLPAGTYTIVDSDPGTWSQNAQSGGRGIAAVRGRVYQP